MDNTILKNQIASAIKSFASGNVTENTRKLFNTLGYESELVDEFEYNTFAEFENRFLNSESKFNRENAIVTEWKYVDLIFQISENEILKQSALSLFESKRVNNTIINSYLFFVVELENENYTRTQLSKITREINRVFSMPVLILFRYGNLLTFSIINRRLHKRDENLDVLEKVSLIKDIQIPASESENTNRAHIEILFDLSFSQLLDKHHFTNFIELHEAWQKTLDLKELIKRFFQEISNWYFWAVESAKFPTDAYLDKENPQEVANQIASIRLLTRFIFVWFLKEKSLVKDKLFDYNYLKNNVLEFIDKNETTYYKAILQNLFFATLNTETKSENRSFSFQDNSAFLVAKYRYKSYFKNPEQIVNELFADVPFLNGGLFDFLDKENPQNAKNPIRIDWFSDPNSKDRNYRENTLKVPDYLFFSDNKDESPLLNEIYNTKKQTYTVRGLINILKSYKFTVEENTPINMEVALDPELLGKVFENLLAYYNPETGKTARKNLGAFYTPREIVSYMVDESLKTYLKQCLSNLPDFENQADVKLSQLIEYNELPNPFDKETTIHLISALNNIKVLDPACGSGAFPMGVLQKIVYILRKLDHDNELWKQEQKDKVIGEKIAELSKDKELVKNISDKQFRERAIKEADNRIKEIEAEFNNQFRNPDYLRKLYIIQDAIYGVDIQPIAVQISKLRFFLSLLIEQNGNPKEYNRGYVPLPNLETKFVAANTLIGLDKTNTLKSPQVAQLETEIKVIRHRHFFAKDRREKREIQKQDETKRKQLENQLKQDGLQPKQAEQIASWNPYDQNQSANFFDVEWMFGLLKDTGTESIEIKILNRQIDAINKQIDVLNLSLQNVKLEHILKLQFKTVTIQLDIIKTEIENIKRNIVNIYGKIDKKVENIASEPENYEYQIGSINTRIKKINSSIDEISVKLKPASESPAGYFDLVIGNPPYVRIYGDQISEQFVDYLKNNYISAFKKFDLYVIFMERGIKLLKRFGNISYIVPDKWLSQPYGEKIRNFILDNCNILTFTNLTNLKVFESATVDNFVFLFRKTQNINNTIKLLTVKNELNFNKAIVNDMSQYELNKNQPFLLEISDLDSIVLQKIENKSNKLSDFCYVNWGCRPTPQEEFVAETKIDNRYKPLIVGSNISKYQISQNKRWVKYVKEMYNPLFKELFENKTILFKDIIGKGNITSALNIENYYSDFTVINAILWNDLQKGKPDRIKIPTNIKEFSKIKIEYILALANSNVISFYFNKKMRNGLHTLPNGVKNLPIPNISPTAQQPFIALVDSIIAKKKAGEDTQQLETEIDKMVYQLYELSDEEIAVVEGKN